MVEASKVEEEGGGQRAQHFAHQVQHWFAGLLHVFHAQKPALEGLSIKYLVYVGTPVTP